ncbi:CPBP family intramembrane glutamic endopeptidase [Brachybacterium kimchii]|uniref:CPBP family intramembrane metalloprotease n=1 Tax=Brachybacterium kimchii TaxID=2942909 RepID=A0ABY4N422_9MICO|nr:CPBP family intramembrane glutamic endopeptidase [Brachybacterium kimchii]UQN28601.1 CPBP family intramembrane metalloprotease [Brachybacterium kimchii]
MTSAPRSRPLAIPIDAGPRTSPPGPRLPRWLRVLLPMIVFLPAAMTSALPGLIPGVAATSEREDWWGAGAYALVCAAPLLAYLLLAALFVHGVDRRPFAALGLRLNVRAGAALVTGMVIAIALLVIASFVAEAAGLVAPVPAAEIRRYIPTGAAIVPVLVLVLLRAFVLQGIGEEVLFRGYVLQTLSRRPRLAVLVTAAAFTLPHLASTGGQEGIGQRLVYLAMPFGFAMSAGMLAIALRSVWAAIGVHGGFHVATALVPLIGFAADGPVVWALLGAAHLLTALVIAAAIPRRRWDEVRASGPYARPSAP